MLLVQQELTNTARFALWKVEEPLSFFLTQTPYDEAYFTAIHHPEKQLEFGASRYLAAQLSQQASKALIHKHPNRMPYFTQLGLQVSLSHTHGLVAAIVSADYPVGIDVEKINERMLRIRKRFIHDVELPMHLPESEEQQIARCWCIKEAVFKWLQESNITFITDFVIEKWEHEAATVKISTPKTRQQVVVQSALWMDYAYAYCFEAHR